MNKYGPKFDRNRENQINIDLNRPKMDHNGQNLNQSEQKMKTCESGQFCQYFCRFGLFYQPFRSYLVDLN